MYFDKFKIKSRANFRFSFNEFLKLVFIMF